MRVSSTLVLLFAFAACTAKPKSEGADAAGGEQGSPAGAEAASGGSQLSPDGRALPPGPTHAPVGKNEAERLLCLTDRDCVITCAVDGSCCGEMCDCSHPMSKPFLDKLRAEQDKVCKDPQTECPQAKCMASENRFMAKCLSGTCIAKEISG